MPLDTTTVYDIAADLLDFVASRLGDAGIVVPDRQYVHGGSIAWDCEQLVVTLSGLTHAFPGEAAKVEFCSLPRHAALTVSLARCVPPLGDNGDPPSAADLNDMGATTLADVWALSYVLWDGYRAGDWGARCHTLLLGDVTVVGPEGGFVAVNANLFLLVT